MKGIVFVFLLFVFLGCESVTKIESTEHRKEEKEVQYIEIHDTVQLTKIIVDSVRSEIHDTIYRDSNGVLHNDRVIKLEYHHYETTDQFKALQTENYLLRAKNEYLKSKEKLVQIQEKKVYVWWPALALLALFLAIYFAIKAMVKKLKK